MNLFIIFFFHMYIKMSKNLPTKYYQENKGKKKFVKDMKIFLRKKKKKSNNMVVNVAKVSPKSKNNSLLSMERNIVE